MNRVGRMTGTMAETVRAVWPYASYVEFLRARIGQVVKVTSKQDGKSEYWLLDDYFYSSADLPVPPTIVVRTPKKSWFEWFVARKRYLDNGFFSENNFVVSSARYEEFQELDFSGYGRVDRSFASEDSCAGKLPFRLDIDDEISYPPTVCVRAPLTLVRSECPVDLRLSLLFNDAFVPTQPTYPEPDCFKDSWCHKSFFGWRRTHSHKLQCGWNVRCNEEGVLATALRDKVKMIWWEALRKGDAIPFALAHATCVKREEVVPFLAKVMDQKGLARKEQQAFLRYWQEMMDRCHSSYIGVDLVDDDQLATFLPQMKVTSKSVPFEVLRLYFRFCPMEKSEATMLPDEEYIHRLSRTPLGANAVIDLGGEIVDQSGGRVDLLLEEEWNDRFIREYIKA